LIVSKQTKLAYLIVGGEGAKNFCPGPQDTLTTPLVRSVEKCPFIQNETAAWRRLRNNGLNKTN